MSMSFLRRPCFSSTYSLAILSGILIGTSYIPLPPWAIFFCYLPLWSAWLKEKSAAKIFWSGWLTQFVLTLIGFNWVSYTVHEFGHLPWPVAFLVLLLFCGFANLYVPLAGLLWFWFCRTLKIDGHRRLWALPIFMSLGERAFPMIFDWHFGYTWLWASFPAFHLADTVGFIGLSNIGLFFNALFLEAWVRRQEGRPWIKWAAAVPVLFLLLNVAGWARSKTLPQEDAKLTFLIVQANIGNQEKLAAEKGWAYRDIVIDRFKKTTEQGLALRPADYIVWPETAFPELIEDAGLSRGYASRLRSMVREFNTSLITGGYSTLQARMDGNPFMEGVVDPSVERKITNSFFIINPEGRWVAAPYHKTVLLAFGEYLPGGDWWPIVREWVPAIGDFGRGPGPTVIESRGVKMGAQICYEGLFDWFNRALANQGAQIIVNLTNDSWYGTWQQPYQHGYMTLARAIEVRRPLVRSTNTGISSVILASGEILELSPLHKEWFQHYEVPYATNPVPTAFMGWGYWLIPTLLGFGLLALVTFGRRSSTTKGK